VLYHCTAEMVLPMRTLMQLGDLGQAFIAFMSVGETGRHHGLRRKWAEKSINDKTLELSNHPRGQCLIGDEHAQLDVPKLARLSVVRRRDEYALQVGHNALGVLKSPPHRVLYGASRVKEHLWAQRPGPLAGPEGLRKSLRGPISKQRMA
jgi:hypothetical protein